MKRIEFYRHTLGEAELASLRETLGSLFLTLGPRVAVFEERFAQLLGCEHVVGTSSCSMGLVLALTAFGVGPGDEVITTPMTFVATPNAALVVGATPVFVDVDPATGLIDPEAVEAAITPKTKAIMPVHLYGALCDMRALRAIADRNGLVIIEDAAHAIEAERDGVRTAQLGDATCFSFYATKTITSGDGGAVACHDEEIAARLKRLRVHGMGKDAAARHGGIYQHWDMLELGFKAAMTDVEAAMLLPQLERLAAQHQQRTALVKRYEERLADVAVDCVPYCGVSGHHLFPILVPRAEQRDPLLTGLGERGIGCAVNYRAVHTLRYYRERFGHAPEAYPNAAAFGDRTVSLPLWPAMPHDDVDTVVAAVKEMVSA